MSVITKTVGAKQYAYLSVREGDRVVHRYLGPLDSPHVAQRMREYKESVMVPERLRPLFWDADAAALQIKKHARYIIERVLELGDLDAATWLQRVYSVNTIIDVLSTSRAISERSRNFWLLWFEVPNV